MTVVPGYDYVATGYRWSDPTRITYSIAPDGVFWDHGTNNLNATFNAKFGNGVWQRELARALATWQSVANINIVPVSDGNYNENALGLAQGDSRFGDIRIGGYNFANNTSTLAQTYYPPPNGSTAAGDVEVNTALNFNINSTYDLYSVLLHELGHSFGLDHTKNTSQVMYALYNGIRTGLQPGDIAGIQSIYGARALDVYQQAGRGLDFGSAIDVSASLTTMNQAGATGVSLQNIGSSEFFTFVAPSYAAGRIQVTAAAANLSMLSPKISLYDASGKLITQASNPSAWSNNATATAQGIVPGQRYYVVVTGATGTVFDTGAYSMLVQLPDSSLVSRPPTSNSTGSAVSPPASSPIVAISPDRLESNNTPATATWIGNVVQANVINVNLHTPADVDNYSFRTAVTGSYLVTAPGVWIQILNARGQLLGGGIGQAMLPSSRAGTQYIVAIRTADGQAVPNYDLSISTAARILGNRRIVRTKRLETGAGTTAASEIQSQPIVRQQPSIRVFSSNTTTTGVANQIAAHRAMAWTLAASLKSLRQSWTKFSGLIRPRVMA